MFNTNGRHLYFYCSQFLPYLGGWVLLYTVSVFIDGIPWSRPGVGSWARAVKALHDWFGEEARHEIEDYNT
jgi:hypothetical protein